MSRIVCSPRHRRRRSGRKCRSSGSLQRYRRRCQRPPWRIADATARKSTLPISHGHWVLVNLWATWCAPCIKEMPSLDRTKAKFGPALDVVAISEDRNGLKSVDPFLAAHPVTSLAIGLDQKGGLTSAMHIEGLPTSSADRSARADRRKARRRRRLGQRPNLGDAARIDRRETVNSVRTNRYSVTPGLDPGVPSPVTSEPPPNGFGWPGQAWSSPAMTAREARRPASRIPSRGSRGRGAALLRRCHGRGRVATTTQPLFRRSSAPAPPSARNPGAPPDRRRHAPAGSAA